MNKTFRNIFYQIHLWLSIPFGIVITVMCLTGAILVFETEILHMVYPSRYRVEKVLEEKIPLEKLVPMVNAQLPDSVTVSSVTIPAKDKLNYSMGLAGQGRTSVLVDPYTGEVKGQVSPYASNSFFSTMRRLHRWFMFPYNRGGGFSWGKAITGYSTLAFVFILISGIVVWIPKTKKALKARLKIKTNAGGRRFWYDTHVAGGMYVLLFLLAFSLTGLTWSFNWYRDGFYKVFGVETTRSGQNAGQGAPASAAQNASSGEGATAGERGENRGTGRGDRSESSAENTGSPAGERGDREESAGGNRRERTGEESRAENRAETPPDGNRGEIDGERRRGGRPENTGERRPENERRGRSGGESRPQNAGEGRDQNREGSGEGRPQRGEKAEAMSDADKYTVWDKVATQLMAENPKYKNVSVQDGSASVSSARRGNTRASDRYEFDPASGRITGSSLYANTPKSGKIRGWIYAVHVGSWGGMTTRVLSFLACLVGASLPVTGYYFYFRKLYKKRRSRRSKA